MADWSRNYLKGLERGKGIVKEAERPEGILAKVFFPGEDSYRRLRASLLYSPSASHRRVHSSGTALSWREP